MPPSSVFKVAASILVVVFAMATLVLVIAVRGSDIRHFCEQIEVVKGYNRGAIERGLKTLPTVAYYKQHPAELKAQVAELNHLKFQFKKEKC